MRRAHAQPRPPAEYASAAQWQALRVRVSTIVGAECWRMIFDPRRSVEGRRAAKAVLNRLEFSVLELTRKISADRGFNWDMDAAARDRLILSILNATLGLGPDAGGGEG
jgi:hypothetical protein